MGKNLFEKAIFEDKLDEFALGLNEYFIMDREYGNHWVLASWQHHIIELLNHNKKIETSVIQMFRILIDTKRKNEQEKIELLLYHLHVYYYNLKNKKIEGNDFLEPIEDSIIEFIESNIERLKKLNDNIKIEKISSSIDFIKNNGGLKKYYH